MPFSVEQLHIALLPSQQTQLRVGIIDEYWNIIKWFIQIIPNINDLYKNCYYSFFFCNKKLLT